VPGLNVGNKGPELFSAVFNFFRALRAAKKSVKFAEGGHTHASPVAIFCRALRPQETPPWAQYPLLCLCLRRLVSAYVSVSRRDLRVAFSNRSNGQTGAETPINVVHEPNKVLARICLERSFQHGV
jgi:hypothetical protein